MITTGSGNDIIDGGGGADLINSGGGNDTVSYYGSESVMDGGTGNNTLLLSAVTTVNLGNVDQTTGDATSVANFQNVDASGLSAFGVDHGLVRRQYHHGRLRKRHDRRRRRRRRHQRRCRR